MGVTVTENEESEDNNTSSKEDQEAGALGNVAEDDVGRTDDPVRMYLRERGRNPFPRGGDRNSEALKLEES